MNKIERKRLEKVIGFLKVLNEEKFFLNETVKEWDDDTKCGSVCCIIGWTPRIFPRLVRWIYQGDVALKKDSLANGYRMVASSLFGITTDLAKKLFCPFNEEDENKYISQNLFKLSEEATPKQAAKMLEKFLKLVDKGEIEV